ncbi:hypothetical protein PNEG_01435 [Pneumocystis murina B123]|uniref:Receptor L-domain domain-containing protein n=1 Tax=Pneumocystis murina (strain B123) TaxID=1069680 RepID=M7NSR7_PNEMU|nr:hypothetical protein PNEG_01435 [Pneumocystis murina B123]EMR10161.1 hypothetical protein PNEG_01435 [Pneumocystis murina B123]
MLMELLILWFYIISFVLAEKCDEDINVKSQTDLDRISECTVFEGSIYVTSSIPLIDLGNLEHILGDLVIYENDDILLFKAFNLVSVQGKLVFKKLTALEKIELPALSSADTMILFQCAQLQTLNLNTGISRLNHITVSDTSLRNISGFLMKSLISLNINNNNYLSTFNMSNLVTIGDKFSFMQNGLVQNNYGIPISLPSLESSGGLFLQSVSSVELEQLKNITGDFGLSLSTLSNLTLESLSFIQGSLSIYNNTVLTSLEFPNLISIGGTFLISDNPNLHVISGFDKVRYIGGSIHWTGFLKSISLSSITDIKGTVKILSSTHISCPAFTKSRAIIQGANPVCKSSISSDSGGASSNRKNGSYSSKKNGFMFIGGTYFFTAFQILCTIIILHSII